MVFTARVSASRPNAWRVFTASQSVAVQLWSAASELARTIGRTCFSTAAMTVSEGTRVTSCRACLVSMRLPSVEPHGHLVVPARRIQRTKSPLLRDRTHGEHGFGPREPLSDAAARPTAEGEITEARSRLGLL